MTARIVALTGLLALGLAACEGSPLGEPEPPCVGADCPAATCADPLVMRAPGAAEGQTVAGVADAEGRCGGDGPESVWRLEVDTDGPICLSTVGSVHDTVLHVRADCGDPGTELACNDDAIGLRSQITLDARSGQPYFVFVDSFSAGGRWRLTATPGPCDAPPACLAHTDCGGQRLCVDGACTRADVSDGFDYPVGSPAPIGGSGFVSQADDGDGYYNAQDFTRNDHCGEDWNGEGGGATDFGDPVYAAANGVVVYADNAGGGWGDVILVQHQIPRAADPERRVMQTQYAHLSRMLVEVGQTVTRGQPIGEIGDGDGAWIPHLHFEMRWDPAQPSGGSGYDCPDERSGMTDPSDYIDRHRP